MASSLITSWQIEGGKVEAVFYFPGLPNHCGWCLQPCIKRHLLLGRKAMTNLNSVLNSRDITAYKGPYSQSYGFSNSHMQI